MSCSENSNSRIKIVKYILIYALVLVMMAAIAIGGVEQGPIEAYLSQNFGSLENDANSFENTPDAGASALVTSEDGPTDARIQSISFKKDWGIRDALQFLAARYKKNIVPSTKVDGLITITNLYSVTFEEALEAILGHGFKYEQEDNFIKVYTDDEYKEIKEDKERMIYKVFTLYYITAEEAAKLIKPIQSDAAKIEKSTPADASISGGTGSGTSSTGSSSGSGGGGDKMALHDTIVLYDYPEYIEKAAEVIKAIDVRPKQVLVEATIISATLTEETKFGIDWNLLAGVALTGTVAKAADAYNSAVSQKTVMEQIAGGGTGNPLETSGFATSGMSGLRIGATSGNLAAFITALEAITDVTILANPKILAVNKQEGMLHVGKTLGYRGSTTISTGGVATQGEDKFLDSGTKLVFRPYIGGDGYIRMDIHPEDSTAQLNVDKVPDKTTAEVKTNILVKDGDTVIIGGLFRDVVTTTRSQVPLLGDLPLAGALFRGTDDKTERQEVMVLLTPHIIEEPNELEGQARAADIGRKRSAAKDQMQWIDRTRLAEDGYAKAVKFYLEGNNESAMRKLVRALQLRPTYMEALRLKEKIIAETNPEDVDKMERIMLETIDQQEAPIWRRR
jgi:type IV pilus assembly protein PilQ